MYSYNYIHIAPDLLIPGVFGAGTWGVIICFLSFVQEYHA